MMLRWWLGLVVVVLLTSPDADAARQQRPKHKLKFRPISLPTDFNSYDLDGDGFLEIQELAKVSETSVEQCSKPFEAADVNIDGLISKEEFIRAPWDLTGHFVKLRRRKMARTAARKMKKSHGGEHRLNKSS
ncbi:PREDICTED: uncharacterized protein LOC106816128 [Priapulus caudatus]|uniref:Uncharacterized protein LOC106816128 n=1 Tax=Priapulus caudatus TaxID=37621 RepID=A0ABM1EVF0_PRICU|nr:PREDICTED: uncharacterized protein LOC106816128 [Priapulus caudatus]